MGCSTEEGGSSFKAYVINPHDSKFPFQPVPSKDISGMSVDCIVKDAGKDPRNRRLQETVSEVDFTKQGARGTCPPVVCACACV
jgi:hypothetical protein